ncbi:MAG: AAA family ATPase [Candidatus Sericytochromatia bacterium]|nr:AAA family ATPase [Candidatus Sericytochromatia bacterium]
MARQESGGTRQVETGGHLLAIRYRHPDSGYTVASVESEGDCWTLVTERGHELHAGLRIKALGRWGEHPRHGRQFYAKRVDAELPTESAAIIRFLASGVLPGIGPRAAETLVAAFGASVFAILDDAPQRLHGIPGLSSHRVGLLQQAWAALRKRSERLTALEASGLSRWQAVKWDERHGEVALSALREDPFALLELDSSCSFAEAERLASSLGLPAEAPARLQAWLLKTLREAAGNGHTACDEEELVGTVQALSGVARARVEASLQAALAAERFVRYHDQATATISIAELPAWRDEEMLAKRVSALLKRPVELHPEWREIVTRVAHAQVPPPSPRQHEAVQGALQHRLFLLSGGPGTGKSTTVRFLLAVLEALEQVVLLAAPTGRAAQRLAELAHRPAMTLHRLLGLQPAGSGLHRTDAGVLPADVVIVDEATMMDLELARHLLEALPPLAHLVLIGDTDQLPSVGPGQVFRDLMQDPRVARVTLETVFRVSGSLELVRCAHAIRQGVSPALQIPGTGSGGEAYFVEAEGDEAVRSRLVNVATKSLPSRLGLDPRTEIQVLTPALQGPLGARTLNVDLQRHLHLDVGADSDPIFVVGNRVMQCANDLELGVFNGDVGVVESIDPPQKMAWIRFGERCVAYPFRLRQFLEPAWAITVHKSQGSEYPAVVVALSLCHGPLLQREVLYTAFTRARRVVVVVGSSAAIERAVAQPSPARRTGLRWHLGQLGGGPST